MDEHAKQLRGVVFEADLERCLYVVHSRQRHIVGQCAVAGNIEPGAHLLALELVYVHHLGKFLHDVFQALFQLRLANNLLSGSIVAGSLSMCVRMVAISGISPRISVSRRVTSSWARFMLSCSSSSRCCSTWGCPFRSCTLTSCTLKLWRVATARMRSKIFSVRRARGTECTTTSASGRTSRTREVTASDTCSERWKVKFRSRATETSAKKRLPALRKRSRSTSRTPSTVAMRSRIWLRTPTGAASSRASTVRRANRQLTETTTPATTRAAIGSACRSQPTPVLRPNHTRASPRITTPLDQMSVEKCKASASIAWLSYLAAMRPRARERHASTAMDRNMTTNAATLGSISTLWKNR